MTKRNPDIGLDDLESEFDYVSEAERRSGKRSKGDFWGKERPGEVPLPGMSEARKIFDDEHSRLERQKRRLMTLDVYSRHKELINQYYLYYPGATARLGRDASRDRTDYDVLRDTHRFLWDDEELSEAAKKSWEARLAKRYYDKLFKEYCIADLSQYKKNRIAMRWRVEKEVRSGKGQFECGNKHCSQREGLTSWEVNFGYIEKGEKKNALVKLRLCPDCSVKLNFHSKKRKAEKKKKVEKIEKHRKRNSHSRSPGGGSNHGDEELLASYDNKTSIEESVKKDEAEEKEAARQKEETEKMMKIWAKPQDVVDPEKIAQEELDNFLDDMFM